MYCTFLILIVLILVINYTFRICRQIATELFQIIFKIVAMFHDEVVL